MVSTYVVDRFDTSKNTPVFSQDNAKMLGFTNSYHAVAACYHIRAGSSMTCRKHTSIRLSARAGFWEHDYGQALAELNKPTACNPPMPRTNLAQDQQDCLEGWGGGVGGWVSSKFLATAQNGSQVVGCLTRKLLQGLFL